MIWTRKTFDFAIKGVKQPIRKYADQKPFTHHQITLFGNETVYVFSDGFPDQFGGERGKKLKSKASKVLLANMHDVSMNEQKEVLHDFFENWRVGHEQIDDICMVGVKF